MTWRAIEGTTMNIKAICLLATALPALAACTTHPLPKDVSRKNTVAIVDHIRCEAFAAVINEIIKRLEVAANKAPSYRQKAKRVAIHLAQELRARLETGNVVSMPNEIHRVLSVLKALKDTVERNRVERFQYWVIAYNFEFNITETNDNSAGANFTLPFSNGSFSLGLNSGSSRSRQAKRTFKMADVFRDFAKLDKCVGFTNKDRHLYPITGSIGLKEVLSTYFLLYTTRDKVTDFTDELTFTTTLSATANPSLTLVPMGKKFQLANADASFDNSRSDIHKVTIALGPPKGPKNAEIGEFSADEEAAFKLLRKREELEAQ